MTGAEHYAEAEKLLRLAAEESWRSVGGRADSDRELIGEYLAAAQVNATLALAAASAELGPRRLDRDQVWAEVLS